MWRALFLGLGLYTCILGVECLLIDKAVLASKQEAAPGMFDAKQPGRAREIVPPDWAPWSLLSGGAVTMLYSFTIPRRVGT